MASNRSELRAAFRALVANELLGDGKLLQALYGYMVADFSQQSPVMVIASSGSERKAMTFQGGRADYLLDIFIFVLYAAVDGDGNLIRGADGEAVWTEENSEEAADEIEQQFGEFVFQPSIQRGGELWKSINYNGPTQTTLVSVGGQSYRQEYIQLRFSTF